MVLIVIMGRGMRLITFSLFGNNPIYCDGAVENARLAKKIYPDWTARFYVDEATPEEYTWKLKEYDAEVYIRRKYCAYDALNWRFLPFLDDTVEAWISRDCDSRLSWRERRAVDEWLTTDRACHLMRDCHNHGYSIMAGMFGINNILYHQRYGKLNLDVQRQSNREGDQFILHQYVWPMIINDHVCHDHWAHNQPAGQPTHQPGDHVHYDQAYGIGLIPYVTGDVRRQLSEIYPAGQDSRPFPDHEPMDHGIFVGQIIEADGTPRMNMDVRWEYELRGIAYE